LVHIGNTYELWIGKHALNYEIEFTEYKSVQNVSDVKEFFFTVDSLMAKFIDVYSNRYLEDLELDNNGQKIIASPLKLFTHVITHEFHHKGQILSFSRHLGYIPIDTDVMR
jgi:uncharacterized damage-inducible protein DinB